MESLIKTLERIKRMCERHEGKCGNCVFKEKRHVAHQEEKYVCSVTEGFSKCFVGEDGITIPPSEWKINKLKEEVGERTV